jgi:uncharacterized membrane protein HdeD (DUF308 family)
MNRNPLHRHWKNLGIRGIAALLFALAAFAWPSGTLFALFLILGAYLLVDSAVLLTTAIRFHPAHETWILVLDGAISAIAGFCILFLTPLSVTLIAYWIGAWALATGLLEGWLAYRMRKFAFSGPFWAFGAAMSVLLGALLLLRPEPIATTLVRLLGLYAVILGSSMLGLAWSLRRVEKRLMRFSDADRHIVEAGA